MKQWNKGRLQTIPPIQERQSESWCTTTFSVTLTTCHTPIRSQQTLTCQKEHMENAKSALSVQKYNRRIHSHFKRGSASLPKPPATHQETFKAIQLLWDLAFECFKEPGFDQLARLLNFVSCTLQKEAHANLQPTKIIDYFGQPHLQASPAHSEQPQACVQHMSDVDDDNIELLEEGWAPVAGQLHREE
jgi:hypothetical protein